MLFGLRTCVARLMKAGNCSYVAGELAGVSEAARIAGRKPIAACFQKTSRDRRQSMQSTHNG